MALDVRTQEKPHALGKEARDEVLRQKLRALRPPRDANAAVQGVDRGPHRRAEPRCKAASQLRLPRQGAAEHDTLDSGLKRAIHVFFGSKAPAQLHGHPDLCSQATDQLELNRAACPRAVEIHDMQRRGSGPLEGSCDAHRVLRVVRRLVEASLPKPNTAAGLQVQGWKETNHALHLTTGGLSSQDSAGLA